MSWRPPAPTPRSNLQVGLSILMGREQDLLETLPRDCYRKPVVTVPIGRRRVVIVNDPEWIRHIFIDAREHFPKSDLMISTLAPLLGEGVLIANGETWAHDRKMLDPAFVHMRLEQMFPLMRGAVDDAMTRLARLGSDEVIDLEAELSHITADIMFRTLFSEPIDGQDAAGVFGAFMRFQRNAPQFNLRVILASDPARPEALPKELMADAALLRGLIARLLEARFARLEKGETFIDFAQSAIDARDESGRPFSRERLIDQLAVFFLAGHETTASSLAWTMFMLSQDPEVMSRLRTEVATVLGSAPFAFADFKRLPYTRAVFREGLRLYPPAAFLTRRALKADRFGSVSVPVDSFVVVSPWLVHRHEHYWQDAWYFRPDRFAEDQPTPKMGSYIPFGLGPRVCTGATIAQLEASLILAELLRRFEFRMTNVAEVFPMTRVTIRPRSGIACTVSTINSATD